MRVWLGKAQSLGSRAPHGEFGFDNRFILISHLHHHNSLAGTYAPALGSAECSPCDAGFYAELPGSVACYECRATLGKQYSSLPGAASCTICDEGFFDDSDAPGTTAANCLTCPLGATCEAGSNLATIVPNSKFYRFGPKSKQFYECVFGGEDAW